MSSPGVSREYAEAIAGLVCENGLAVVFSWLIDAPDAGKKGPKEWQKTEPWPAQNQDGLVAQIEHHYGKKNLLVVTRPSRVVTVDCDSQAGLDYFYSLELPVTVTVRSGRDDAGYHFVFRPPADGLDYSFFELAGNGRPEVTAAVDNKLHVLAGVHKSGRQYALVKEHGLSLATMPQEAYEQLASGYNGRKRKVRRDVVQGKRVAHPGRHQHLATRAGELWNKGIRGAALDAMLHAVWEHECEHEPAKDDIDAEIAGIVDGAERKPWDAPTPTKRPPVTETPELARRPDILAKFQRDLHRLGIAGENHLTQIVYLALTSRVLPWEIANRPVSVLAKGTSSTGKSFTVGSTIRFFPEGTVETLSSASTLYLLYDDDSDHPDPDEFSHKFIYVPEWTTIKEKEELVALLRILVSEGRVVHGTVEGAGKKGRRKLSKNGPTGLLMTTTATLTDLELETRCLSIHTDDSPEQTRAIFRAIAKREKENGSPVAFERWHELQCWIEDQDNRTVIPFAGELAELMPTNAVRLRRDFTTVACLTRSHAILHQAQRQRDTAGRIIVALDDYDAVRRLLDAVVAEELDAAASKRVREVVAAVKAIVDAGADHATVRDVTEFMKVGKSEAYNRVSRALRAGYIANISQSRTYKLRPDADLPDEVGFLPTPEALRQFRAAHPSGKGGKVENSPQSRMDKGIAFSTTPSGSEVENILSTHGVENKVESANPHEQRDSEQLSTFPPFPLGQDAA